MQKFDSISDKRVWDKARRHLAKNDKILAKLIKRVKYRKIDLQTDHYGSLVVAMINQQISGKAGDAILRKFKALYKGRMPSPKMFLATPQAKVRGAGISPQKYSYIKDLCERIEDGRLEMRKFGKMPDERIIEELDEVRGIGRWTAEMYLMFTLGRVDVVPVDDLAVKKGIQKAYGLRELPDGPKIHELSRKWHPYGSIASLYIWRGLEE